jgi:hypothetical protein
MHNKTRRIMEKYDEQNSHPYVHGTFDLKNFTVTHFTSLQNKITSHKSSQFTPHHYTSPHFTYLHSIPTWMPLLVTTFLTLFLKASSTKQKKHYSTFKYNPQLWNIYLTHDQPRGLVVRVSDYRSWGHGFDSRFCHVNFSLKGKIPLAYMVWVVSRS